LYKAGTARLHLPRLLSTTVSSFLLDGLLLGGQLSDVSLDLTDLSLARKISLQTLHGLLQEVIAGVVDFMGDVDVVGVGTAGTETVFTSIDGSLLQQRAEVFKLTRVQFEMILQVLDDGGSGVRDLLGLDGGQSSETHIGEAQN
jgi:hypothetical protein